VGKPSTAAKRNNRRKLSTAGTEQRQKSQLTPAATPATTVKLTVTTATKVQYATVDIIRNIRESLQQQGFALNSLIF